MITANPCLFCKSEPVTEQNIKNNGTYITYCGSQDCRFIVRPKEFSKSKEDSIKEWNDIFQNALATIISLIKKGDE